MTARAILTGWYLFIFFTVATFLSTPTVMLDFCFILVASNTVIWASSFAHTGSNVSHRILFSMFSYSPGKLSKLWHGNSCFAFCKKFWGFIFFLIFFLCSTQFFKSQLKHTQDAYILFVFFYFQVACNCSNSSKQEVKRSYYILSIKGQKCQLGLSKLLMS